MKIYKTVVKTVLTYVTEKRDNTKRTKYKPTIHENESVKINKRCWGQQVDRMDPERLSKIIRDNK